MTGWDGGEAAEYQKALALDPAVREAPLVHDALGTYFLNHGQTNDALAQYQMAAAQAQQSGQTNLVQKIKELEAQIPSQSK